MLTNRPVVLRGLVCALMATLLAGCSDDASPVGPPPEPGEPPATLSLQLPSDSLFLGRTMRALVTAVDTAAAVPTQLSWSSSDSSVVVVDESGMIVGLSDGSATVSVRAEGQSAVSATVRVVPMRVAPDGFLAELSATKLGRLCGLTPQGRAACLVEPSGADTVPRFALLPDAMSHQFVQFASNFAADCGLTAAGEVWCTGWMRHYILATAFDERDATVFRRVQSPVAFKRIAMTGHTTACGIARDDDRVYCWGHNSYGVLGRPDAATPADSVVAPIRQSPAFADISSNLTLMCGVGTDAAAYCWGQNTRGRDMQAMPDSAQFPSGNNELWMLRRLMNAPPFTSVVSQEHVACGLTADGTAYCGWGPPSINFHHGVFGRGHFAEASGVAPVASDARFRSLVTDNATTQVAFCGVTTTDQVHCWGSMNPPALRTGLGERRARPVAVLRGVPAVSVVMRGNRQCAVTRAGGAVCW
jgi:hypothetical protein